MSVQLLAQRYLDAYSNCFPKEDQYKKLLKLKDILQAIESSQMLKQILFSPIIKYSQKRKAIVGMIEKSEPLLLKFVLLIMSKQRTEVFSEMNDKVDEKISELKNIVVADVYSSATLRKTEEDVIISFLRGQFNKNVEINYIIDESILAGIKIFIENKIFDIMLGRHLKNYKVHLNKKEG